VRTIKTYSKYNYELEAEKLMWEAHSRNKLLEFQKLVARYEQIMDRPHALICAHKWLINGLI